MSLVVVVSEDEPPASLQKQLDAAGYTISQTATPNAALELCFAGRAQAVVCNSESTAVQVATEVPRVPVVWLVEGEPDADALLRAVQSGLADVWQQPLADDTAERLGSALARFAASRQQREAQLDGHLTAIAEDQKAGRTIQECLLPDSPLVLNGYRFEQRIVPSLLLSGDFVDYFAIDDAHFLFYLADVSGHGASSAFVTVFLKTLFERLGREADGPDPRDPAAVAVWLNRELLAQQIDKHVALLLGTGTFESGQLSIVNAGHFPLPIHVHNDQSQYVSHNGRPLGLFPDARYTSVSVNLESGDRLVMFSDGVLDMLGDDTLEGKENELLDAAKRGMLDCVWRTLGLDGLEAQVDDMTALVVAREA